MFLVIQNRRIATAQFPGVKERRPVNQWDEIRKRNARGVLRVERRDLGRQRADADELRLRQIIELQFWRAGAGFFNRNKFRRLAAVLRTDAVVFLADLQGEVWSL